MNGVFLKLLPGTQISQERNSPLFDEDGFIPGSFSIPFDIPNDPEGFNARALGIYDVVEQSVSDIPEDHPAELFFDGSLVFVGVIKVKPNTGSRFRVTFFSGLREVSSDFKDLKLSELNWDAIPLHTVVFSGEDATVVNESAMLNIQNQGTANLLQAAADGKIGLHRIENPSFQDDADYSGVVNDLDNGSVRSNKKKLVREFEWVTNIILVGRGTPSLNDGDTISMTVDGVVYTTDIGGQRSLGDHYERLIELVPQTDNFKLSRKPKGERNEFNLLIFDDWTLVVEAKPPFNSPKDFSVFSTIDSQVDWEEVEGFEQYGYLKEHYYAPTFRFSTVFERISNRFNIQFVGNFFEDSDFQTLTFYPNRTCNIPIEVTSGIEIENSEGLGFEQELDPADYMPDWSCTDFIKYVARLTNSMVEYEPYSRSIVYTYKNDLIQDRSYVDAKAVGIIHAPIEEIDHKPSPRNFTIRYANSSERQDFGLQYLKVTLGNGAKPIELPFRLWTQFEAVMDIEEGLLDEPYLFFDRGLVNGQYTSSQFNSDASLSLRLANTFSTENFYYRFHKRWYTFMQEHKTVRMDARFLTRHLNQLEFGRMYFFDRNRYFIRRLKVGFAQAGVAVSDVEVVRVN